MKNLILFAALACTAATHAANVTQWRGEERRGIFHEKNLLKDWKARPPKELWYNEDLGDSYASVTVIDEPQPAAAVASTRTTAIARPRIGVKCFWLTSPVPFLVGCRGPALPRRVPYFYAKRSRPASAADSTRKR